MSNYKKIGVAFAFFLAIYCLWVAVIPAKVVKVNKDVVFVEHLPMTNKGKLNWWLENKDSLQNKYHIFNTPDNFTITIMNFGGYKNLPTGTRDGSVDDYTCFDNTNHQHKNCVYNDIAIVVRGSLNGKKFINIDGKTYIQTGSEKVTLYKTN
jgi:hypothetical protein